MKRLFVFLFVLGAAVLWGGGARPQTVEASSIYNLCSGPGGSGGYVGIDCTFGAGGGWTYSNPADWQYMTVDGRTVARSTIPGSGYWRTAVTDSFYLPSGTVSFTATSRRNTTHSTISCNFQRWSGSAWNDVSGSGACYGGFDAWNTNSESFSSTAGDHRLQISYYSSFGSRTADYDNFAISITTSASFDPYPPTPPPDSFYGRTCDFLPPPTFDDPDPDPIEDVPATLLRNDSFERDAWGNTGQFETYFLPPANWVERTAGGVQTTGTSRVFPAWLMDVPSQFATAGDWSLHRPHTFSGPQYLCQQVYAPAGTRSVRLGMDARHGPNSANDGTLIAEYSGLWAINETIDSQSFSHFTGVSSGLNVIDGGWQWLCLAMDGPTAEIMVDRVYLYSFAEDDAPWDNLICPDPDLYDEIDPPDPEPFFCEGTIELEWDFNDELPWEFNAFNWGVQSGELYYQGGSEFSWGWNYLSVPEIIGAIRRQTGLLVPLETTILSNDIEWTIHNRVSGNQWSMTIEYIDGGSTFYESTQPATGGWSLPGRVDKTLKQVGISQQSAGGAGNIRHYWDDFSLTIPCENLIPGVTPDPLPNPDPFPNPGGQPIPIGGAMCQYCPALSWASTSWYDVVSMILLAVTWSICWLRQLFGCYLIVWFAYVVNASLGLLSGVMAGFNWLTAGGQTSLNYLGQIFGLLMNGSVSLWDIIRVGGVVTLRNLLRGSAESELLQALWGLINQFEYIRLFASITLTAIMQIFNNLYDAALTLGSLTFYMIASVVGAITTNPYDIVIGGQDTIPPDQLFAPGPNATKVLWITLVSLFVVDDVIGRYQMQAVLIIPTMALCIAAALWTISYWRKILPN